MIKYKCSKCGIQTETSLCPECNERTEIEESKIYWCKNCNIPIFDKYCSQCGQEGEYISTDIRPVFPEERLLIEILIDKPLAYINSSVWNASGNKYIIDGEKLNISLKKLMEKSNILIREKLQELKSKNNYRFFNENIKSFINANRDRYNYITSEAIDFIKEVSKTYEPDEMIISFSGGKDSTVTRDLVVRSLGNPKLIHLFGDTTLEFPMTLEYINRFRKQNNFSPVIVAKNKEKDFFQMCDIVGPPSRVMRWCCTVFKTGAITRKMNSLLKDKNKILTFYGIRRIESNSRSKYDKISESPKILKQKVVSPIIDWLDFDIWLYILTTGIDFNDAYRLGYSRVGCWCCPNNSMWSQYLSSIYLIDQHEKWRNYLISFAKKIGKPDPEAYVDDGKWKARQGGNGIELSNNSLIEYKPCLLENNSFSYELKREITDQLYELFKPFGKVNKELGNEKLGEVYILDKKNNPIIKLQGKIGSKELKISILKNTKVNLIKQKIDCQITKYQMCVGCLACESICKYNAISIKKSTNNDQQYIYYIDEKKCINCMECVNYFDGGCYIRKVLTIKRSE